MVIPEHILAQDVWLFVIVMLILVGLSLWSLSRTERKEDERRKNRHVRRTDSGKLDKALDGVHLLMTQFLRLQVSLVLLVLSVTSANGCCLVTLRQR
jgi:hypothetical protein